MELLREHRQWERHQWEHHQWEHRQQGSNFMTHRNGCFLILETAIMYRQVARFSYDLNH
jgi:hypothetical protein